MQKEVFFSRGFCYYNQRSYSLYACKAYFFKKDTSGKITLWKSTGIDYYSVNSDLKGVTDGTSLLPALVNDRKMSIYFSGNYFRQNNIIHPNNKNIVNIYIVCKFDQISYARNTDFTIQNALFCVVKVTEDATDKFILEKS